jgi:hypothetical protein
VKGVAADDPKYRVFRILGADQAREVEAMLRSQAPPSGRRAGGGEKSASPPLSPDIFQRTPAVK